MSCHIVIIETVTFCRRKTLSWLLLHLFIILRSIYAIVWHIRIKRLRWDHPSPHLRLERRRRVLGLTHYNNHIRLLNRRWQEWGRRVLGRMHIRLRRLSHKIISSSWGELIITIVIGAISRNYRHLRLVDWWLNLRIIFISLV